MTKRTKPKRKTKAPKVETQKAIAWRVKGGTGLWHIDFAGDAPSADVDSVTFLPAEACATERSAVVALAQKWTRRHGNQYCGDDLEALRDAVDALRKAERRAAVEALERGG